MKIDLQLALLGGLTIVMWGCWGFFGKIAIMKHMAPTSMFLVETMIGVLCAAPLVAFQTREGQAANWNIYGVLSGMGLAIGLLSYYLALRNAQAAIVVPLTATYPLVSVLLSFIFLKEHMRPVQVAGALLVVTGTVLLLLSSGEPRTAPQTDHAEQTQAS